jgi:hypothetical protein
MIYQKITPGFVVQQFDTAQNKYVSQEFVAGSDVDYEDLQGNPLDLDKLGDDGFGPLSEIEPYLPFDMKQPE